MSEEQQMRNELEAKYGKGNVWNTDEMRKYFTVEGFAAPCCIVIRKSDRRRGTLEFTHLPRFYFDFIPH